MLKPISKIALVLFITFLSGLVMTDSILPEFNNEERAEIEIEEEEEIESIGHVEILLESILSVEGGGNKINLKHQITETNFGFKPFVVSGFVSKTYHLFLKNNKFKHSFNVPIYIYTGNLKLFS